MIVFPTCKINLGLRVRSKRADGYHELETIFYSIPLTDALEVIRNPEPGQSEIIFTQSGLTIDAPDADNLCVRAYKLLQQRYPSIPPVLAHLHKVIPMGAGLGGGSSDAAFMLQLLNKQFSLRISNEELLALALLLGSDCPFFIYNHPCYATGRGEKLEPLELNLEGYNLLIVNPGIHVSTAHAFHSLNRNGTPVSYKESLKTIIQFPVKEWKEFLINEFEEPVMQAHPEIAAVKEKLYASGAVYASMTGSGSSLYGFFKKGSAPDLTFPESYFVRWI